MATARVVKSARITGRVQGVAFRAWTRAAATRLGLRGWVRNDADGAVSAVLAGPEQVVDAMVTALHEGPAAAAVRDVQVRDAPDADVPDGFEIRR